MVLVAVVGAAAAAIASGQLPRAGERKAGEQPQLAAMTVTLNVAPPSGALVGSQVVLSANVQHMPLQISRPAPADASLHVPGRAR
jgi:hypothetical protein